MKKLIGIFEQLVGPNEGPRSYKIHFENYVYEPDLDLFHKKIEEYITSFSVSQPGRYSKNCTIYFTMSNFVNKKETEDKIFFILRYLFT